MKEALISRWLDLRASVDPRQAGWIVPFLDMWRIEAILKERYQYHISLTSHSQQMREILDACK